MTTSNSDRAGHRFNFPPGQGFPVVLHTGRLQPLVGYAVDLSIGGILVEVEQASGFLPMGSTVSLGLALPEHLGFVTIEATIAHQRTSSNCLRCGLRFLAMDDPAAQEQREEALWQLMLAEQRRANRPAKICQPTRAKQA
jgi:c-di-GMP-binding flagellar brake protein YcgR